MSDDLTALRLQLDWGADEALGDVALDRFAPATQPGRRSAATAPQSAAIARAPGQPSAAGDANATAADSLDALHAMLDRFTACPLRATATNTVRPSGSASGPIVLIADAPGSDDDRSGQAFSGPAGATLDRVMGSIGLTRERMLLTTLVPWRPPGNRPPSESEIQACLPFVHRLLQLVRPQAVLLAGAAPVAALTGQTGTIRQLRGKWLEIVNGDGAINIAALPILPLAQWLRDAGTKQQLWSDLLLLHSAVTSA